ncbi:hypothetical protein FB192DRAFT_1456103 [Mucor lusitanicus]|uniref:Uncharacterized protein n=1 Tax=Mucor circinelloides f. lusitanicus TaxID=29924 RepID=A0A8H4F756_MUCCL|nr:hypothetical protein FB192DRAFT_1456103 [Mucor lusitanicus]
MPRWLSLASKGYTKGKHIVEHQKKCWYKVHEKDPDKQSMPGFNINDKKGDIQGTTGFLRNTSLSSNGYPVVRLSPETKTQPVHLELDAIENGVMDHIDSNPQLNHIRNLRPVTTQQNQVYACGISVVVLDKSTEASTSYDSINNCAGTFGEIYPNLKHELHLAEKTVDKDSHILFHRDPRRIMTFDKFYLDQLFHLLFSAFCDKSKIPMKLHAAMSFAVPAFIDVWTTVTQYAQHCMDEEHLKELTDDDFIQGDVEHGSSWAPRKAFDAKWANKRTLFYGLGVSLHGDEKNEIREYIEASKGKIGDYAM